MKTKKEKFNVKEYPQTFAYVVERNTFNRHCNKCQSIVLKADNRRYDYQCMSCDEDLYEFETYMGEYQTDEEFNDLLNNSLILECDT